MSQGMSQVVKTGRLLLAARCLKALQRAEKLVTPHPPEQLRYAGICSGAFIRLMLDFKVLLNEKHINTPTGIFKKYMY